MCSLIFNLQLLEQTPAQMRTKFNQGTVSSVITLFEMVAMVALRSYWVLNIVAICRYAFCTFSDPSVTNVVGNSGCIYGLLGTC